MIKQGWMRSGGNVACLGKKGKPDKGEGKRSVGRPTRRWKNDIDIEDSEQGLVMVSF
jgi:hypothetical protein